ncbi:MAG: LON peptidase substrate-binding domain-containing protein [Dehalococcoidia bacterium]
MEVPLFPLRTVLFPGMDLPLRIFEERYRQMTRELLESGGMFGVLLIKEGQEIGGGATPHSVGTLARIEASEELPNGQFVLSTRGVERFRLMDWLPPRPYPFGGIELLADADGPGELISEAIETVRATFPAYFRTALSITDQWARGLALPREAHALVNFVGPWLQVDEDVKQRLLEIESGSERVAYLAEVVDDLLTRTREQAEAHRREKYGGWGARN